MKGIGMFFDREVYLKQRILGLLGIVCLTVALSAPMLVAADEPEVPLISAWNSQFGDGDLALSDDAVSGGQVLELKQVEDGSFGLVHKDTVIPFSQSKMEEGMSLSSLLRDHQWRVRVARRLRQQ